MSLIRTVAFVQQQPSRAVSQVAITFWGLYPELTEAIDALGWCYTFDYK
jgi:hypothetical protein